MLMILFIIALTLYSVYALIRCLTGPRNLSGIEFCIFCTFIIFGLVSFYIQFSYVPKEYSLKETICIDKLEGVEFKEPVKINVYEAINTPWYICDTYINLKKVVENN